jgi:hypothetical protein
MEGPLDEDWLLGPYSRATSDFKGQVINQSFWTTQMIHLMIHLK